MQLNTATLQQVLFELPPVSRYTVAYSGGVDSHALLVLMSQLRESQPQWQLQAIHVHHGLQAEANDWVTHCEAVCHSLSVPLKISHVTLELLSGESVEAAARQARYQVFQQLVSQGEAVLLAHHLDDQAETLLLQMLRGAGVAGMAAMPQQSRLAEGWLLRPLLGFSRQQIEQYVSEQRLNWVDDPSNRDTRFDRNFLRHEVMPVFQSRWPSVSKTLSRVASYQAEASLLLEQLAEQDYQRAKTKSATHLSVSALLKLNGLRQRNLLRYWIKSVCHLPLPDHRQLQHIQQDVLAASGDATPCVSWQKVEVRRYRDELFAQKVSEGIKLVDLNWPDIQLPLPLVDGSCLQASLKTAQGLKPALLKGARVEVRFRRGGEQCRPVGRGHRHSLKKLFQEWGIPPWQRAHIPLLFVNDELAQVVGYCICEPFQANNDEKGLFIEQTGV